MKIRTQRGFTLLEIMLAIALFALVSAMVFFLMQGVVRNGETTRLHASRFNDIQHTLLLLEQDVTQAIARYPAQQVQQTPAEFRWQTQPEARTLQLVRANWLNPGSWQPRASLQRVTWRWQQNRLERLSYREVDNLSEQTPQRDLQLAGVSAFQLRFWHNGHWEPRWYASFSLPEAIEVTLDVAGYGQLQRIFLITVAEK